MELKIVKLKGLKFKGENNIVCELTGSFGFYDAKKGYVSFTGTNEKSSVKTPYSNKKKVLQDILDAGGLTGYGNVEWLQPIN